MSGWDVRSKERRFFSQSSYSGREIVIAVLSLVIGLEIGLLYAVGGTDLWLDLVSGQQVLLTNLLNKIALGCLGVIGALAFLLACRAAYLGWDWLPRRWKTLILLAVALTWLVDPWKVETFLWIFGLAYGVLLLGRVPPWVWICTSCLWGLVYLSNLGMGVFYSVVVLLVGASTFPTRVTTVRYLIPRRGAL